MSIWVVTGRTESGDEVSAVFNKEPTKDQVDGYFYNTGWSEEYRWIGFIDWSIEEQITINPNDVTKQNIKDMKIAVRQSNE